LPLEAKRCCEFRGRSEGRPRGHSRGGPPAGHVVHVEDRARQPRHRSLAVAADVCAMVTSSLYLILTASVTMRSGLSIATVEAFAAIAIGAACGTIGGIFAEERLERRLPLVRQCDTGLATRISFT